MNRKSIILIAVGSFTISISLIISQLFELPGVAKGLFFGIGIGLLVLSIIFNNRKTVQ